MPKFILLRKGGRITVPASIRRAARMKAGDLLEVSVEQDGSIRLRTVRAAVRALNEKHQLTDIRWVIKQKGPKRQPREEATNANNHC